MRRMIESITVTVRCIDRLGLAMRLATVAMYRFQFYLTVAELCGKARR